MSQRATTHNLRVGRGALTTWVAFAAQDVALETVLGADYWVSVAATFRRFDEILILHEGGEYETRLRVWSAHPHFAFREIPGARSVEAKAAAGDGAATAEALGFKVSHGGKTQGWRVQLNGEIAHRDGAPLINLGSKQAATDAMLALAGAAA